MPFSIKKTRQKEESVNKSLYLKRALAERIEKIHFYSALLYYAFLVCMWIFKKR